MDKRVFLLVLAAAIIGGLCAFKAMRSYSPQTTVAARPLAEPAPEFELYDQSSPSRIVRLEGYLGRHRVVVVFFDGRAGAHASDVLSRLKDNWSRLHKAEIYVMAISTALPQENRKDIAQHVEFPFPLLSDPGFQVHRTWGRFDEVAGKPSTGVFLVDRKGSVAWSRKTNAPEPTENWQSALERLVAGQ
ncbi:MAG TPA: redoxin domain-containing protein [Planctomycetaceae bacterium]|jgi:peroxiredoxin|nr:redoxin domain-containing protein [Planctomycetaceae bacterium]